MRAVSSAMAILMILVSSATTQTRRRPGVEYPWPPASGGTLFRRTLPPGYMPTNLKSLAESSILIVDATVDKLLAPRTFGYQNLETDAQLWISQMLKGPRTFRRITVAQAGGTIGQFTAQPQDYSMMKPGERYVLFLTEDGRPNLSRSEQAPRYAITGAWAGLFRVDPEGKLVVKFSGPRGLLKYDGVPLKTLLSELAAMGTP